LEESKIETKKTKQKTTTIMSAQTHGAKSVEASSQPLCNTHGAAFKKLTKNLTNNIISKTIQ
jgi:hypothetical protein